MFFLPTALPVGVSRVMPPLGGITPLTCTIFDPTYFGGISRNHVFHISPTRLNNSIMGNYLDFGLKIAHRGKRSSLLCVLSEAVGKREDQATGVDIDFP